MPKIIQDKDESKQLYYELTPERLAILDLIAFTEGTDREIGNTKKGYNLLFGGGTFTIGKDHPRIRVKAGSLVSTAAGRYQILDFTWDMIQSRLKTTGFKAFPSFEPIYQDQAVLFIIDFRRNALTDVDSRSLSGFLDKCSFEFASLPDSSGRPRFFSSPVVSVAIIRKVYNQLFDLWNA